MNINDYFNQSLGRAGHEMITGASKTYAKGEIAAIEFVTECTPTTLTFHSGATGTYSGVKYPAGFGMVYANINTITLPAGESAIVYFAI